MASKFKFETREQRILRMAKDNPGRSPEICAVVVDGIWYNKKKMFDEKIPQRFKDADMADLGYVAKPIIEGVDELLDSPQRNDVVGLLYVGPAGSGKTYAAYATLKMLSEKNPEIVSGMFSYPQMIQNLRSEFSHDAYDDLGSTWDRVNNHSGMYDGLLFLDDLTSQKPTDFEVDKLTTLIDRRVNEFLPFIITTNVSVEDMGNILGERLTSRLLGFCKLVEFEDIDRRVNKEVK